MIDKQEQKNQGILLETLSWPAAERVLNQHAVVVIPLGAAAKEHGPHLPLNNDALIAQWLSEEIRQRLPVVIAPLINASYYPAFSEYPGSISLQVETARNMLLNICRSLAAFGPRKFYVLNTGVSTEQPLSIASNKLKREDIQLEYLRLHDAFSQLDASQFEQHFGSHADEIETSLMLHIANHVVDMTQAVDDGAEGSGCLSRVKGKGTWSESGVYGQATLATEKKGRAVAKALIQCAVKDISLLL